MLSRKSWMVVAFVVVLALAVASTALAGAFGSTVSVARLAVATNTPVVFNSGDSRINQDSWAPIVIFCPSGGGVNVSQVLSRTALSPLFSVTAADITAAEPGAPIASSGEIVLYKLADGSLQINAPLPNGKIYIYVWNGCPRTWSTTYEYDPVRNVTTRAAGYGGR